MLQPGIVGMRGSIAIRLRPYMIMSTPPASLVQEMSAWSVETRHAPSRHCRHARAYGHTTTAMHEIEYICSIESPPLLLPHLTLVPFRVVFQPMDMWYVLEAPRGMAISAASAAAKAKRQGSVSTEGRGSEGVSLVSASWRQCLTGVVGKGGGG